MTDGTTQGSVLEVFTNHGSGSTVYVLTLHGLYRSDDGGNTYAVVNPAPIAGTHAVVDPTDEMRLFATGGWEVFLSEDGGATFTSRSAGLPTASGSAAWLFMRRSDPSSLEVVYPDGGVFRLAHVSNFRPVKRTADIVRVFFEVQKRRPAHLTLAGQGPDLGIARELCAELDICEQVTFAGASYDIQEVYRQNHLFLLLSDYESFGLSALEALACGTPAVASRAGGLTEVIEDNETGLLCPVGRVEEIAERIVSLLMDRDAWEAMSRRAARSARLRFSRDEIVPQYESYYESLLNKPKEAP